MHKFLQLIVSNRLLIVLPTLFLAFQLHAQIIPGKIQKPLSSQDSSHKPIQDKGNEKKWQPTLGSGISIDTTLTVAGTPAPKKRSDQKADVIPGQYIIVLKKNAATNALKSKKPEERKIAMRAMADSALRRNGLGNARVKIAYGTALIGFTATGLSESDVEKLRRDPRIAYVEPDQMASLFDDIKSNDPGNTSSGETDNFFTEPPTQDCSILTINGKAYVYNTANFGQLKYSLSGDLALINDGLEPNTDACQPVQNNLSGKIAVLDRGNCEFGFKALQAQNAGAIAVILVNNVAGFVPVMGAGSYGNQVTIPVISVSLEDGNEIKAAMNGGPINATLDNLLALQCTPWGIARVGGGLSGEGKRAWVIDGGIDLTHPDLNVNTTLSTFFVGSSPQDQNGHGTHVAGTIAAKNNAFGVVGVAAGAEVVAVRVFDASGSGPYSVVIQGVDYVAAHAAAGDVANMSLGGPGYQPLDDAVLAASAVCKFVLAAGNAAQNANLVSPARVNGPNIYTVSAMGINDNWAPFSNFGNPPVDYCEPGVNIISCGLDGTYKVLSGTSMAAPHLSGLLLLGNVCATTKVNGDPDKKADWIGVHFTGTPPDNDGDGFNACSDCDDNDPTVYPGAPEICDGKDNDCDGIIDNGNICCNSGNILYVKADATGTNTGTSWTNAYTSLQSALNSNCPNVTQIWVAAGTYNPSDFDPFVSFSMKNGLAIYGGFPGMAGQEGDFGVRDWATYKTVLSGDIKGDDGPDFSNWDDNSAQVIFNTGLNNTAILDGVTVYGGGYSNYSGGMTNLASSPTISNVTFASNWGNWGGAMFLSNSSNPIITNCTFDGNKGNRGGAIQIYSQSGATITTITGCRFTGNRSVFGGAILVNDEEYENGQDDLIVTNSYFENNVASSADGNFGSGGAIFINKYSGSGTSRFTNCQFFNNKALGLYGGIGGHIFLNLTGASKIDLINCTLAKGYARNGGGSIFSENAPIIAINTISANNSADAGTPNIGFSATGNGTLTNCLLDSECPAGVNCVSSLVSTDPKFMDVNSGNLRLNVCSPAIDAGTSVDAPLLDMVGAARFEAIPGGGIVDIGAFEYQGLFNGNVDADDDGYTVCGGDCNDNNPAIYPGAPEICDGLDNNCDGQIDEGNICCSAPTIVYVNAAANGLNNGSSWADAFTSLQTALSAACASEIWVAEGVYRPATNGDRSVSFVLKNGVAIFGGFPKTGNPGMADRNWEAHPTVLSGDLLQNDGQKPIATNAQTNTNTFDNTNTIVIGSGTDASAILDGFFITAGNTASYRSYPNTSRYGGGMYLDGGSPTIKNCDFSGNWAFDGGGIYAINGAVLNMTGCRLTGNVGNGSAGGIYITPTASFHLTDCSFTTNAAKNGNGGGMENASSGVSTLTDCRFSYNAALNVGGGMINRGTNLTMTGCTFTGNRAVNGAGLIIFNSSPVISNCNFIGNVATNWGGGIINESGGNPAIRNCLFQANQALFGGGLFNNQAASQISDCSFVGNVFTGEGGGAALINYYDGNTTTVTNCEFRANLASRPNNIGAVVINQESSASFVNCSFSKNAALGNGACFYNYGSNAKPTFTNCILFGNATNNGYSIINDNSSSSSISYTLLQEANCPAGSTCGAGMIYGQDPIFAGPTDLRLSACSPAIDAGIDAANSIATDLDGNTRKFDAYAGGALIDMGAYEFQSPGTPLTTYYTDADGDGYGTGEGQEFCQDPGNGWATVDGDCDDEDQAINPGATEICDGIDNNCNGQVDEGFNDNDADGMADCVDPDDDNDGTPDEQDCAPLDAKKWLAGTFYTDADGDGYGSGPAQTICYGISSPAGVSTVAGDCDDTNPAINPGATEICDGIDNNCDGKVDEGFTDTDGDSLADCVDPDDDNDGTPDADDCAPLDAKAWRIGIFYTDADGDGYGTGEALTICYGITPPAGVSMVAGDCDDADPAINPGAAEVCDGIDNNCNGQVDEGFNDNDADGQADCVDPDDDNDGVPDEQDCAPFDPSKRFSGTFYTDADGDGLGTGPAITICHGGIPPAGYATNNTDCNDADASIWRSTLVFIDMDGDGYDAGTSLICIGANIPAGYSTTTKGSDCNDNNAAINPGATEICDGIDNNCDGQVDEGFTDTDGDGMADCVDPDDDNDGTPDADDCAPLDAKVWRIGIFYTDADGDGYGTGEALTICYGITPPAGVSMVAGDCDDADHAINPGATEVCDGIDNNCNGLVDEGFNDTDADGMADCVDPDDDNDGIPDADDCAPLDPRKWLAGTFYTDADGDGYGSGPAQTICYGISSPAGVSTVAGDCNDNNAAVNPGATEICDGIDNDCDGKIDEGFTDTDADGMADCVDPDDDNDGTPDEQDCAPLDAKAWKTGIFYTDADGDGFGSGDALTICYGMTPPAGMSMVAGDCDDANAAVNPNAIELCGNGIDDNCNGQVDESCNVCPLPQGDWKTNPDSWPASALPMKLGTKSYTKSQLLTLLNTAVKSDASLILAYQLIGAKLNVAYGASPTQEVLDLIAAADAAIGSKALPGKVKTSSTLGNTMTTLALLLEDYNQGRLNPRCQASPAITIANKTILTPTTDRPTVENYPNPFNAVTIIRYTLPKEAQVSLSVFSPLGQKIAVLANGRQMAGTHTVRFDGSSKASGIYLYQLQTTDTDGKPVLITGKMLLTK